MEKIKTDTKILNVAEKLFSKKGYDCTSIRDIAKDAGVNVAMIYYYFETKENLYKKIIIRCATKLNSHIEGITASEDSEEKKLFKIISMYLTFFSENKQTFKIILREIIFDGKSKGKKTLKPFTSKNFKRYDEIIKSGVAKGVFKNVDTELTVFSMMGMILFFFTFEPIEDNVLSTQKGKKLLDRLSKHIYTVLLEGIKKQGGNSDEK